MKLTTQRYVGLMSFQSFLLFADVLINTTSPIIRVYNGLILAISILQSLFTILAFSTIFLSFFATYVFQVGMIEVLNRRFRSCICICMVYFFLTLGVNVWGCILRANGAFDQDWSAGFLTTFSIHRICSAVYYFSFKRAFLGISDPRFYDDDAFLEHS